MNSLQSTIFRIFLEFSRVCESLGLRYYADSGTLLGAVRHHGFIPWDDDMDFVMPREDYDVFLKRAPDLLPKHLFLQTYETDSQYPYPYLKIKDCRTIAKEGRLAHLNINHGAWIDVFPMIGLPEKEDLREAYFHHLSVFWRRITVRNRWSSDWKSKLVNIKYLIRFPSLRYAQNQIASLFSRFSFETSQEVMQVDAALIGRLNKTKWFAEFEYCDFEGTKMRIPRAFNELLCFLYGDWKTLPPLDQRRPHHGIIQLVLPEDDNQSD